MMNLINRLKNYWGSHIDKRKTVEYLIIGAIAVIFNFEVDKENHEENQKIFDNPIYAIGELTYFFKGSNGTGVHSAVQLPYVNYKYNLNGVNYKYDFGIGQYYMPTSGFIIGKKYLVICLKTDPKLSRMLFDYPIKNSTDFIKYLEKFKKNPPPMKER